MPTPLIPLPFGTVRNNAGGQWNPGALNAPPQQGVSRPPAPEVEDPPSDSTDGSDATDPLRPKKRNAATA